jgi:hypothetical protein
MDAPPNISPPAIISGLPRPPAQVGPVTVPSVNSGNQVQAHAQIKNAAEMLQGALLQIPMGSEQHTELLNIVKKLATLTADAAPDPAAQMQSLLQMARAASQRGAPPGLSGAMPAMAPPSASVPPPNPAA